MDIATLQSFFMWCTILNLGLLTITSLVCTHLDLQGSDPRLGTLAEFRTVALAAVGLAVFRQGGLLAFTQG